MAIGRFIIGANYGDEGKGTVTAHYAKQATGSVLNVLTNGGPQRGHTVVCDKGTFTEGEVPVSISILLVR